MSRPAAAAGGAAALAALAYALAGRAIHGPSVFGDELIYMEAARSLAHGGGLMVRDAHYTFGPLYPLVLAPLIRGSGGLSNGYAVVKIANAVLFSLAAWPVYLLARRVVSPWWCTGVAAMSVIVPSSLYTALVFTEDLAYPITCFALLAFVLALERPTVRRQVGCIVGVVAAAAVRPQLAVLAPVVLVAGGIRWALLPREARPGRPAVARLWPLGVVALLAIAVLVSVPLTSGSSPIRGLGAYSTLWRSYHVVGVLKWTWYSLGAIALYVALVPVVVAPAIVAALVRTRVAADAAFVSLFVAANAGLLLLVGAFSSTSFGEGRLHDRYLFYLVPLWLVFFAVWLERRLPVGRAALGAGFALALLLVVALPPSFIVRDTAKQLDGVSTAFWIEVRRLAPSHPEALRLALALAVIAVAAAVLLLPVAVRAVLVLPVLSVFVVDAAVVWHQRAADANKPVFTHARAADEEWVDHALPGGTKVTTLYVASTACNSSLVRAAFLETEFFNRSVGRGLYVGVPSAQGVPAHEVHVRADGAIVDAAGGRPLDADAVLGPPHTTLRGRELRTGTTANLRLWIVNGRVRVVGARSDSALSRQACGA